MERISAAVGAPEHYQGHHRTQGHGRRLEEATITDDLTGLYNSAVSSRLPKTISGSQTQAYAADSFLHRPRRIENNKRRAGHKTGHGVERHG